MSPGAAPPWFRGPSTPLGATVAAVTLVLDQGSKVWLLHGFDLPARQPVRVAPVLDLVVVWNVGISYGLFPQTGVGRWALVGLMAVAVVFLWVWLARADLKPTAIGLGLIIGGAIGNGIDRAVFGAVFDFALLHWTTETTSWRWYVFNVADVAIVAGVVGLCYELLVAPGAAKVP